MFSVRGRGVSAGTIGDNFFNFWNPHATLRIYVLDISISLQAASGAANKTMMLSRSNTVGTPASTITPGISSHHGRSIAPPSGCTLGLGDFTVQPATDIDIMNWVYRDSPGNMFYHLFDGEGYCLPPSHGLTADQDTTTSITFDVTIRWREAI